MADPKKSGWKTSEFWAVTITSIFAAVNGSGTLPFQIPESVVATIAALVGTFVVNRMVSKNAAGKVEVANVAAAATVEAAQIKADSVPASNDTGYKV